MKLMELIRLLNEVHAHVGPDVSVGVGMGYLCIDDAERRSLALIKFKYGGGSELSWVDRSQEHG